METAGLTLSVPKPFIVEGFENNIPESDWEYPRLDDGIVALPDSWVASKGLPEAQRYPWDTSKGLYHLHGYHNLHCVASPSP